MPSMTNTINIYIYMILIIHREIYHDPDEKEISENSPQ